MGSFYTSGILEQSHMGCTHVTTLTAGRVERKSVNLDGKHAIAPVVGEHGDGSRVAGTVVQVERLDLAHQV